LAPLRALLNRARVPVEAHSADRYGVGRFSAGTPSFLSSDRMRDIVPHNARSLMSGLSQATDNTTDDKVCAHANVSGYG
jgi:hypothetical protein